MDISVQYQWRHRKGDTENKEVEFVNPYILFLEEHCRSASLGDYKDTVYSCIMSAVALDELLKACKIIPR